VVTILANLSVLEQCASEVLQEQGIERLLLLLAEKPSSSSPSEGAACERVQQKAAVTLARLSRDYEVAQTAIQLKAVPRLIELCRSPTERNNSDSVLVACLVGSPEAAGSRVSRQHRSGRPAAADPTAAGGLLPAVLQHGGELRVTPSSSSSSSSASPNAAFALF
ncbi:unnamed protein product, partial [Tetraodon nigroviridis]